MRKKVFWSKGEYDNNLVTNLLESRVVELVLVATGDRRPHTLVGPQAGEGVAQEGKQHLVLVKAAAAGQDRVSVNLQQKINMEA